MQLLIAIIHLLVASQVGARGAKARKAKAAEVLAMHADRRGPSYIAQALGISRMSVHRILKAASG